MKNLQKGILGITGGVFVFLLGCGYGSWKTGKKTRREVKEKLNNLQEEHARAEELQKEMFQKTMEEKNAVINGKNAVIEELQEIIEEKEGNIAQY